MIEFGNLYNKVSSLYETLVACVTYLIRLLLHIIIPYGSRVRLKQAAIPSPYHGSYREQIVIQVNSSNLLVSSGAKFTGFSAEFILCCALNFSNILILRLLYESLFYIPHTVQVKKVNRVSRFYNIFEIKIHTVMEYGH